MNVQTNTDRFDAFVAKGIAGQQADIDFLMLALLTDDDFPTSRLVDYSLSLVDTVEGREQIKYYLYHGCQVQWNYAALYFKRKGHMSVLDDAVAAGKIDSIQAYSR